MNIKEVKRRKKKKAENDYTFAFGIFEYSASKRVNDCDWPIPRKCIGNISAKN